jgi:hypothetical protein
MEETDWIDLVQEREKGWDLENTINNLWVA